MKTFNQTISVEVSVDTIAVNLRNQLSNENPHADMLTETIIGAALNAGNIGMIYNALCGFSNELNFKVGQTVYSETKDYRDGDYHDVGNCTIIEIDPYRNSEKIRVQYTNPGQTKPATKWVNHMKLSEPKLVEVDAEQEAAAL